MVIYLFNPCPACGGRSLLIQREKTLRRIRCLTEGCMHNIVVNDLYTPLYQTWNKSCNFFKIHPPVHFSTTPMPSANPTPSPVHPIQVLVNKINTLEERLKQLEEELKNE